MIQLSAVAIAEINRIKSQQGKPQAWLRLGVAAGGCSDFYYTLELAEVVALGDQVIDCRGVQVVINAESWPYIEGLMLDYSEDLMGGGFRFNNPNAASTCGCGNSFALKAATPPAEHAEV
jgi:iron-sulfur cluster assembly accessory protein